LLRDARVDAVGEALSAYVPIGIASGERASGAILGHLEPQLLDRERLLVQRLHALLPRGERAHGIPWRRGAHHPHRPGALGRGRGGDREERADRGDHAARQAEYSAGLDQGLVLLFRLQHKPDLVRPRGRPTRQVGIAQLARFLIAERASIERAAARVFARALASLSCFALRRSRARCFASAASIFWITASILALMAMRELPPGHEGSVGTA